MVVKMPECVIDSLPEINKPLSAKYYRSFAYPTFKQRIPDILQGIVDEMIKKKDAIKKKYGQAGYDEIHRVTKQILELKHSMQNNQPILEISGNGEFSAEVQIYNREIEKRKTENNGSPPTWFSTEWLFAECYLYFKLHQLFYTSSLRNYDPFMTVKVETLLKSRTPLLALASVWAEIKKDVKNKENRKEELFSFFVKCSLWGNKADLSLSGGKSVGADTDTLEKMNDLDEYILVNQIDSAYKILHDSHEDNVVDIVLDNAGYELVNDLFLADFLIWSGLAKKIIFHGKAIPWFVSDVTKADFEATFNLLEVEVTSDEMKAHVNQWKQYLHAGVWTTEYERFWILPYGYRFMKTVDPELYDTLGKHKLVIFKGDLNYRKLDNDMYLNATTSFKEALGGFEPTNVVALRTVKADTVSGLPENVFEELTAQDPNWLFTGQYALVQLSKPTA